MIEPIMFIGIGFWSRASWSSGHSMVHARACA